MANAVSHKAARWEGMGHHTGQMYTFRMKRLTRLTTAVCALGYATVRKQGTSVWLDLQSVSPGRTRLPNTDL